MPKYANKDLAELAHQLQLSPKRKRLAQIKGIESVLRLACPDKSYPYDMVCYHVTGYRNRRAADRGTISGGELIPDLVLLAEQITRKTPVPADELGDAHRSFEDVAEQLQVSTKTIRRWRPHGLMGFKAQFDDGVSRVVYLQSTVDRFVEQNKALVDRGAAFKQLTDAERADIVVLARELLGEKRRKLHVVAREISEHTGRAIETIRYTLRRYDQANPDEALFSGNGLPAAPPLHRRIWTAHQKGDSPKALAGAFGIGVAAVGQVLREMTVRELKAEPVSYVPNALFDAPQADALILDAPRPKPAEAPSRVRAPRDLPAYLKRLYATPLMTAEQEVDVFRRYNYIKHKLSRLIDSIDVCEVTKRDLAEVSELRERAEHLRSEIVQANLRLVVSIAKKHVGWSPKFFEVISDGNISLMRAVEKFDYARGFKFSTYASWAIMKNYARTVPEEHYHAARYVTGQDELIDAAPDPRDEQNEALDRETLSKALEQGMRELTDRERVIVTSHFGLFGTGPANTLEQLGARLGVTKERVRQIERRAIDKMKGVLSPALADLLPD